MRGIALRQPIGFGATAEHIMQLEKLDDPVPAIAEQLVEPIGVNRHSGAARGEIVDQRIQRQFDHRSEEHTSELQSLMRISYAVFCLKIKTKETQKTSNVRTTT